MAKVIEVYEDKAGEYRWRKIRGSKNIANQGEGHKSKQRTMSNALAESENGEYVIHDLTVDPAPDPVVVENPVDPETIDPPQAEAEVAGQPDPPVESQR